MNNALLSAHFRVADHTSATGASANRGLTWLETPFNTRDSREK
jgi:hypothetical protein